MSSTRYDYRLYCLTESRWVEGTCKSKPSGCFNNLAHTIDTTTITLLNTISPNEVVLREEDIPTTGNYKCESITLDCKANSTTVKDLTFPYPINLLTTSANIGTLHEGNEISVYFIPESVIGATTQIDGALTAYYIPLGGPVINTLITGLNAMISDNDGSQTLGTISSIDKNNNRIIITDDANRPYNKGSNLKFSYNETGLTEAPSTVDNQLIVSNEFAAKALIGISVFVNGQQCGNVQSVLGNIITVTGTLSTLSTLPDAGASVVFSFPTFETPTIEDFLPNNVLEVSDSCVEYAAVGMRAYLTDGVNKDPLGRIASIDKANKRINIEIAPTHDFAPGSYLQVTRYFIDHVILGGPGIYPFSAGRNKGSYIDVGRTGRFEYKNETSTDLKFTMRLEYLH